LGRLLLVLTNKLFEKLQKTPWKVRMPVLKKTGDIFGIGCNYTLFITFGIFENIKINGLQYWVAFYVVHRVL
jgi:hypothetical protein